MAQPQEKHPLVTRVIRIGWVCVAISALFLYLSGSLPTEGGDVMQWALLLMVARLFGLASFTVGAVAIYNRRFGEGIALFGVSIALPVLSFLLHGTL